MELLGISVSGASAVLVTLIGGWFAVRVHRLEDRVDELEEEERYLWRRNRQLIDHIYRTGGTPPPPLERITHHGNR